MSVGDSVTGPHKLGVFVLQATYSGQSLFRRLRIFVLAVVISAVAMFSAVSTASATNFSVLLGSSQAGDANDLAFSLSTSYFPAIAVRTQLAFGSGYWLRLDKVGDRCQRAQALSTGCPSASRLGRVSATSTVAGFLPVTFNGYVALESERTDELAGADGFLVWSPSSNFSAPVVKPIRLELRRSGQQPVTRLSIPDLSNRLVIFGGLSVPASLRSLTFTGGDSANGGKRWMRNPTRCGTGSSISLTTEYSNGVSDTVTRNPGITGCPSLGMDARVMFNPREYNIGKRTGFVTSTTLPDPAAGQLVTDPSSMSVRIGGGSSAQSDGGAIYLDSLASVPACPAGELASDRCPSASRIGDVCVLSGVARRRACGEIWFMGSSAGGGGGGGGAGGMVRFGATLRNGVATGAGAAAGAIWIGMGTITSDADGSGAFHFQIDDLPQIDPRELLFTVTNPLYETPIACGENPIFGRVTGASGLVRDVAGDPFTTVNCPVTITSPTDGLVTNENDVAVEFSSTDAVTMCSIDGSPKTPCVSGWRTGPLPDGPHTLVVGAETCDEGACQDSVEFVVDTTGPQISNLSPSNGDWVACTNDSSTERRNLPIRFTISNDSDSDNVAVAVSFNRGPRQTVSLASGQADQVVDLSIDCREMTTGLDVEYSVFATDEAGNESEQTATLRFDTEPAKIELPNYLDRDDDNDEIADDPLRPAAFDVAFDITDIGSGVDASRVMCHKIHRGHELPSRLAVGDLNGDGYPDVCVVEAEIDGDLDIEISAADHAGNVSKLKRSFTIDSVAPRIDDIQPRTANVASDTTLFQFRVTDDNPGSSLCSIEVRFGTGLGRTDVGCDDLKTRTGEDCDDADPAVAPDCRRTLTLPAGTLQPGSGYTLRVTHTDLAGNSATATYDFTAVQPLAIEFPDYLDADDDEDGYADFPYRPTSFEVLFDVVDSGTGVDESSIACRTRPRRGGVITGSITIQSGNRFACSLAEVPEGETEVEIEVTDSNGRVTTNKRKWIIESVEGDVYLTNPEDQDSNEDGFADARFRPASFDVFVDVAGENTDDLTFLCRKTAVADGIGDACDSVQFCSPSTQDLDGNGVLDIVCHVSTTSEGDHHVTITATDRAGNTKSATIGVTIDRQPPSLVLVDPPTGDLDGDGAPDRLYFNQSAIDLVYEASDAGSGIDPASAACRAVISGRPPRSGGVTLNSQTSSTRFTCSLSGLEDGEYEVQMRVFDSAGHGTESTQPVTIDRTRPEVAVLSPGEGEALTCTEAADAPGTCTVPVQYELFDSTSDVSAVASVNGGPVHPVSGGGKSIREIAIDELNIDVREMTTGLDVEYRIVATDTVGNTSESTVHFRVEPPAREYVALGDSYTAGAGIEPTTTEFVPSGCLQSTLNYPRHVQNALGYEMFTDVSCTFAEIEHLNESQTTVFGDVADPQFNALSSSTDLVTLGIGGNDVGFWDVASVCLKRSNANGTPCQDMFVSGDYDELRQRIDAMIPELEAAIDEIRLRAPAARLLVVGYPQIAPSDGVGCWPALRASESDIAYLDGVERYLNAAVQAAVEARGATFVDLYTPSIGHDSCKPPGERWVEPMYFHQGPVPLHPNADGEQAAADAILNVLAPPATS